MASSMNAKRWLCDTCKTDRRVIGKLSFCACRPIGKGNNGCVYKGKFEGNVDIAVKRILKMAQETGIATTVESETLSRVDGHLNIVRYYATEQDEDFWYIGMELCAGTLYDVIEGEYGGPPIGSKREVLHQIASGLEYLHGKDIVHRDIKPHNILISIPISDREVPLIKLADFGLSRQRKGSNSTNNVLTSTGKPSKLEDGGQYVDVSDDFEATSARGTFGWMGPEILILYDDVVYDEMNAKATISIARLKPADIFSTALVFGFFLSEGRHPFGYSNSERARRMRNKEPMLLTVDDLRGDVKAFELIQSMVDYDPLIRPTATQVLQSINSLKNCGNFALGNLTGCDTCLDKPCRIGSGGFATVFKGKFKESLESSNNKIVIAIKSIERAKVRMSEIEVIRMLNEMKAKGQHQQENIVRFYDWNQDDKCLYIALELCRGTLGDLVKLDYEGERIGAKRDILRQIVTGLVYVHTVLRVIHRDLNPKNILYTGTPDAPTMKLADFGLCRIVQGDQTHQTLTIPGSNGEVNRAGTWDWMAPEMHTAMHFNFDSDIFPLGLICGFTLTKGQHPFDSKHPRSMNETTDEDLLNKRIDCIKGKDGIEMDVKVKQFTRQFIDSRVYKLIEWMLKKDRKSRPTVTQVLGHPFLQDDQVPLDFSENNLKNAKQKEEELLRLCSSECLQTAEDTKKFDSLIMNDSVDINCTDQDGHTPFMLICKHRNADSILRDVKSLLTRRKDVTREGINGISAAEIVENRDDLPRETEKKLFVLLTNGIK